MPGTKGAPATPRGPRASLRRIPAAIFSRLACDPRASPVALSSLGIPILWPSKRPPSQAIKIHPNERNRRPMERETLPEISRALPPGGHHSSPLGPAPDRSRAERRDLARGQARRKSSQAQDSCPALAAAAHARHHVLGRQVESSRCCQLASTRAVQVGGVPSMV